MEFGRIIEIGAHGRVYKSKDEKYAIKTNKADDKSYVLNEQKILKTLQGHPNIIKIFSFYEEDEVMKYWIFMELAQTDLNRFKPPGSIIQNIIKQLFSGLTHIHSHKIIHGDLKPCNILVFDEGKRIAITDFGNSVTFDQERSPYDELTTLWFRAPENLAHQSDWDEKIDVWSMGCVCYYLIFGKYLYSGQDETHCLKQISHVFGYLEFKNPPLLHHELNFWNTKGKIYNGESISQILGLEKVDKILNACLVPIPEFRKSAQEISEE